MRIGSSVLRHEGAGRGSHWLASDADDFDEFVKCLEVVGVAGVQRYPGCARSCSDKQVDCSCASCLSASCDDGGVDAAVGARCFQVERQRIESGLGSLQAVLPTCSLIGVGGGMWPRCQFGHRDCADSGFDRQLRCSEFLEVNNDRGVEESVLCATVSHEDGCPDRPPHRGRSGIVQR